MTAADSPVVPRVAADADIQECGLEPGNGQADVAHGAQHDLGCGRGGRANVPRKLGIAWAFYVLSCSRRPSAAHR